MMDDAGDAVRVTQLYYDGIASRRERENLTSRLVQLRLGVEYGTIGNWAGDLR